MRYVIDVRYWHKADMGMHRTCPLLGESGHQLVRCKCPLLTQSGHHLGLGSNSIPVRAYGMLGLPQMA